MVRYPKYHFDFPSVSLHEMGHGLSLSHFGTTFKKDGERFAKPHAVMNPFYHSGKLAK